MAFRWRAYDGQFKAVFESSFPSSTKKAKKNVIQFGPPLTKLSGSAHELNATLGQGPNTSKHK